MRISDWSSDVCSSDLIRFQPGENAAQSQDPADRHPSSPETSIASGGQPQADDIDAGIKWIIGLRIRRLGGDDRHPPAVTRQPVRQHADDPLGPSRANARQDDRDGETTRVFRPAFNLLHPGPPTPVGPQPPTGVAPMPARPHPPLHVPPPPTPPPPG